MKRIWAVELDSPRSWTGYARQTASPISSMEEPRLGPSARRGSSRDDDIDVVMKREDYDKLLEIGGEAFSDPYFCSRPIPTRIICGGHAQLRNSLTTGISPVEMTAVSFNQGIFIDIFPLDWFSKKEIRNKARKQGMEIIRRMLTPVYFHAESDNPLRKPMKRAYVKGMRVVGFRNWYSWAELFARKQGQEEHRQRAALLLRESRGLPPWMPEWTYESTVEVPFEFMMLPAPIGYDQIPSGITMGMTI